jgi:nucleotide-binding universal stress UspA family protein
MFHRILVAIDLTGVSKAALDRADTLAREERAHLHILHVASDPAREPWVVEAYGIDRERLRAEACGKGHRALVVATRRLGRDARTTTLVTRVGEAADEILTYAGRHAVDLIVIGTRGQGRLAATLLGSVADKVVRGARCPVMIVRSPAPRRSTAAPRKRLHTHERAFGDRVSGGLR